MSEEQLKAFLEKVKSDTELQEKLKAAASPEAALEIVKEAGFSITAEDMQSSTVELLDEELEGAAGGRRATFYSRAECCRWLSLFVPECILRSQSPCIDRGFLLLQSSD